MSVPPQVVPLVVPQDEDGPELLWAIVVAGGSGARFGASEPKQYLTLGDRRILDWSLEAMRAWCAGRVVLVVPSERLGASEPFADFVVAGGSTRAQSVRNGLAVLPPTAQVVLVHDAARPLVDNAVVADLVAALRGGADAAIPGLPVVDTIKRVKDGFAVETMNRNELVAVQTPQAFSVESLRLAHSTGGEATDDAALVERNGGRVAVVPGSERMRKVTTHDDLAFLELLVM